LIRIDNSRSIKYGRVSGHGKIRTPEENIVVNILKKEILHKMK